MNWKRIVGKLAPWLVAAVTGFLKEVVGVELSWWPTACALFLGIVQFVLSVIPDKKVVP
jgi:hypothetical protein